MFLLKRLNVPSPAKVSQPFHIVVLLKHLQHQLIFKEGQAICTADTLESFHMDLQNIACLLDDTLNDVSTPLLGVEPHESRFLQRHLTFHYFSRH